MATIISRKYEVLCELGQGSMGTVYKVRHTVLDTIFALKILPAHLNNPEMTKRFYREARIMARLNHPNIVRVLDIAHDDIFSHYFVMEYIQGKTLRQHLQERGPLPLPEVLGITRQVARALEYAHSCTPPVIHRDIKPANIMIEDTSGRVVVMDFGIAKELDDTEMTKPGVVMGTLRYCAPEQLRHEPLDGRADIYALGMVMYEAHTGTSFFAGLDEARVIGQVLYESREHEPRFTRPTPPTFTALITKAIAKARDKRCPGMTEFLRDLEACWSDLDETKTVLVPARSIGEFRREGTQEGLEELEEQIRKLEAERQRRFILPLQLQAREAREKAARDGAGQWASSLFQQGLACEESGHEHLRQQQYSLAQEAYQGASSLFTQAYEKTIAAMLLQKVEHARQEVTEAKAEAERYGAKEKARTFYGRGVALQVQADELWKQQAHQQARQVYSEARSVFEDARELAYRTTLKEEAEAAQGQVVVAQERAVSEGAEEVAPQAFQEAARIEQRAAAALEAEEFPQARELYHEAHRQYELARQQAHTERQRQHALAVKRTLEEARRQAVVVSAGQDQITYGQAAEAEKRGESRFAAQEYERAAQAYEQAREGYVQAAREAEHERNCQTAKTAHQQMEQARAGAERAGVGERFADAFAQAQQKAEQGRGYEERKKFSEAKECYEQAAQQFGQLRQEAEQQRARELAEAARMQVHKAREAAQAFAQWAQERWPEAQSLEVTAEKAWNAQDYRRAHELYTQIGQGYERVRREAEQEQARQTVLAAQQLAFAARAEAEREEVQRYAAELFEQGIAAQERAERSKQAQEWSVVVSDYSQAQGLFARAVKEARQERARQVAVAIEQERLQQQALEDHKQTVAARRVAEGADADGYAKELYQEATKTTRQVDLFANARNLAHQEAATEEAEVAKAQEQAVVDAVQNNNEEGTQSPLSLELGFDVNADVDEDHWVIGEEESEPSASHRRMSQRVVWILSLAVLGVVGLLVMLQGPLPPLTLRRAEPQEEVVSVNEGGTQLFVAEAAGTAPLHYEWTLDGQPVSREMEWSYHPLPGEGSNAPKRVAVRISDQNRQQIEKHWRVIVPPNEPPRLMIFYPPQQNVELAVGATQEFRLEAIDPERGSLTYEWAVNGKAVGTQPTFTWKIPGEGRYQIQGMVRDPVGLTAAQEWQMVAVAPPPQEPLPPKNTPPQIVQRFPDQPVLTVQEGEKIDFSAVATDPEGEELSYVWSVNDQKVAQGDHFSFRASNSGAHRVDLIVIDQGWLRDKMRWEIQVEPPPPAPRLVTFTPHHAHFSLFPYQSRWLGVEVEVPGVVEPTLHYQWKVNGRPVQGRELYEFKDQPIGVHQVDVTVATPSGASISRRWTVEVREEEREDGSPRWSPRLELFDVKDVVSTRDQKQITVTGKVRNIDERSTQNIIVWITALDKNNQPLLSRMSLPIPQSLAPDEIAVFRVPIANLTSINRFHVEVISK